MPSAVCERLKGSSKSRITSFLKEVDRIDITLNKMEIYHISLGLDMLYEELV